jgi:hypothetical protein
MAMRLLNALFSPVPVVSVPSQLAHSLRAMLSYRTVEPQSARDIRLAVPGGAD